MRIGSHLELCNPEDDLMKVTKGNTLSINVTAKLPKLSNIPSQNPTWPAIWLLGSKIFKDTGMTTIAPHVPWRDVVK